MRCRLIAESIEAAVVVPPLTTAVPSKAAETAPSQRDHHRRFNGSTSRTDVPLCGKPRLHKAGSYSAAIGTCKQVIGDGLRSRAGSILRLLGLDLSVPDHSTLSRRGRAFAGRCPRMLPNSGPIHFVLDSTGLKLISQGEWNAAKHGRTRRNWRKLHLAVDAGTGEIAAHMLTDGSADEAGQPPLLRDVEGDIAWVTADGAYDGDPTYQAVAERQRQSPPDVILR